MRKGTIQESFGEDHYRATLGIDVSHAMSS